MKIAIDAGHGMNTLGKRCLDSIDPNETREWWLNNRISSRQEELLAEYEDVETLRLDDTTGKVDVPIKDPNQRANKANEWGADLCISNHHNAGIYGGEGGGFVIFAYLTRSATEKALQEAIYNECMARGGLHGRAEPIAQKNLAMVRDVKCDALLIEYGFMDSTTDTPIILTEEFAENMAQGVVAAIVKHYKLKKKGEDKPMTTEEKAYVEELEERIEKLESSNKEYHWYEELPSWARPTIKALHMDGVFAGGGAGDMALPKDMMRVLFINARSGVYGDKYKNL